MPRDHLLLTDTTIGLSPPPDDNLQRLLIRNANAQPKLSVLSSTVPRLHQMSEPALALRDIILDVFQHITNQPKASIARQLPGKILSELIQFLDLKTQALSSPLLPPPATRDNTLLPPTFLALEISFSSEKLDNFRTYFPNCIDDPSNHEWEMKPFPHTHISSLIIQANQPFLQSYANVISLPNTTALSCWLSETRNQTHLFTNVLNSLTTPAR